MLTQLVFKMSTPTSSMSLSSLSKSSSFINVISPVRSILLSNTPNTPNTWCEVGEARAARTPNCYENRLVLILLRNFYFLLQLILTF